MRFKSHLVKEETERAADSEDKEVSLCLKVVDTSVQEEAMPSVPLIETSYQDNKLIIGLYGKEGYTTQHGI